MSVIMLNKDKDLAEQFLYLVPGEFRKYCEDEAVVKLGAAYAEEDGIAAAGIVIAEFSAQKVNIKWLFTDPDYRGRGAGEELLGKIFEMSRMNGIDKVAAEVPSFGENYVHESGMAGFLTEYFFNYVDKIEADGMSKFVLEAPNNGDVLAQIAAGKEIQAREETAREYDSFPNKFTVTEVEYYSGVAIDEQ